MRKQSGDDRLTAQYDAPPDTGMQRYWMSVDSWLEDWPEDTPFFFWETGSSLEYRLRPSMTGAPDAEGLPPTTDHYRNNMPERFKKRFDQDDGFHDRVYISNSSICMLVDAPDDHAAWALVRNHFPDMRERFILAAPEKTLSSMSRNSRFTHPNPPDDARADLSP